MKIEEKAVRFMTALTDVYKDDESRDLYAFGKMDLRAEDVTDDFTAMLLAFRFVFEKITGDNESDLIDFVNILNKLAFQYMMEGREENANN